MEIIEGDLLDLADQGRFDYIIHGCNCQHLMSAGIAGQIRRRYPQAYEADRATVPNDPTKLGTYSQALCQASDGTPFRIINAYTQFDVRRRGGPPVFDYTAFYRVLDQIAQSTISTARWGFPMIGAGLAGGDYGRALDHIRAFSERVHQHGGHVTLVRYQPLL